MDQEHNLNPAKPDRTATAVSRPKKSRANGWSILMLIVASVCGGYLYFNRDSVADSDQSLLATATIDSIENTISSAGTLKPSKYVDVGAQVSGQLESLYVGVGDTVEAGQLLAEIDARTQQSRVAASRAAIEAQEAQITSRQAALALAKTNAERQERLKAADATSQLDYDTANLNLANAEASLIQLEKQIIQARASLVSDETELEFARIYAPMAGTVVSIEMNEGRTLNANQQAPTILRLANLSTMTVEAEISEADIGNLKPGMGIYFTTLSGGSRRWHGELRQILPTPVIENNVVLYTGLFDIENTDGSLLPEMTAQVFFIISAASNVLTIPIGALSRVDVDQAKGVPAAARPLRSEGPRQFPRNFEQRDQPGGEEILPIPRRGPGAMPGRQIFRSTDEPSRSLAMVKVVNQDGSLEQRIVEVGVSSRISAQIISGLVEGEQVIAGIIQPSSSQQARNAAAGPGVGGFPGGFR